MRVSLLSTQVFLLLLLFATFLGLAEFSVVANGEKASLLVLLGVVILGCMLAVIMWMSGRLDNSSPRPLVVVRTRDRWLELSLMHRTIFLLFNALVIILCVIVLIYFPHRPSLVLLSIFAIYLPGILYFGERPLFGKSSAVDNSEDKSEK